MSKTEQTKIFLQKAINNMPDDFALREVKFHLQQAANKLAHVEKKRATTEAKKLSHHQQWQEKLNGSLLNPYTLPNTIDMINNMLADETSKLEEMLEKKKKSGEIIDSDEDTIFG